MKVERVTVRQISFPLTTPYKLSAGNKVVFDPFVVEVQAGGETGLGECMISPGYTSESREGSWQAAVEMAMRLQGVEVACGHEVVCASLPIIPGFQAPCMVPSTCFWANRY